MKGRRFAEDPRYDATAHAALAKSEVSAGKVLETTINRAEQINPSMNAIAHKHHHRAGAAVVAGPSRPLGVPYSLRISASSRGASPRWAAASQGVRGRPRRRLCAALQGGNYLSITPLDNAAGTPAMSVPLQWAADGLPVGVRSLGFGAAATLVRRGRARGGTALV